ncbi:MAG: metallophosphoesterase [Leadbetterella sp.]
MRQSRIVFMGIMIAIFLLVDFYIFQAVKVSIRGYEASTQKIIKTIYWLIPIISLASILLLFFVFPESVSPTFRTLLMSSIFVIYVSKLLAAVFLLITDIVNLIRHLTQKVVTPEKADANLTRSEFFAKSTLAVAGTHMGLMAYGILSGAHDYKIHKVKLVIKNLPKAFHGLKLAQLSDIHSGSFFNKTAVSGGVDMVLAQKPDMVFFTGDLVNNEAKEFNDYFNVFKRIKAPMGVYSTLGNHDYGDYVQWESAEKKQKNLDTLIQAHKDMGWDILMDENRSIRLGNDILGIIGIQNWGQGFVQKGDLKKALNNTQEMSTKLLLSHDPTHWRAQVLDKTDIDVAFAGHTHGMQYGVEIGGFKWSPVQYRYKEWAGLYQENDQQLYVNRGFGYIGFPGRVGILPEITIFELQAV